MINEDFFAESKPNDVIFFNSDDIWHRCENYSSENCRLTPIGKSAPYKPFENHIELLTDFFDFALLILSLYNEYILNDSMSRKRKVVDDKLINILQSCMNSYRSFALKWGMFGIGFDRILSTSFDEVSSDGTISTGNTPTSYSLRNYTISDSFFSFNNFQQLFCGDGLPDEGSVSFKDWINEYGGNTTASYSESVYQLLGCDTFMRLIDHILGNTKCKNEPYIINAYRTEIVKQKSDWSFTWKFTSLIGAISILYANNLTNKSITRVCICPCCSTVFKAKNSAKIYCSANCKNTMAKRRQRKYNHNKK